MATRRGLCDCFPGMALADPDREPCACGAPTPPGKWRCATCQADVDRRAAAGREARTILEAARREASRERWGDDG